MPATTQRSHAAQYGTRIEARVRQCSAEIRGIEYFDPGTRTQRIQIQSLWRRRDHCRDRTEMKQRRIVTTAADLDADRCRFVRAFIQRMKLDPQFGTFSHKHRRTPRRIDEFDRGHHRGYGVGVRRDFSDRIGKNIGDQIGRCIGNRGTRHLQQRDRRQHGNAIDAIAAHRLIATQVRAIALATQQRRVLMQQRMRAIVDSRAVAIGTQPIAFPRERIAGQRDALRARRAGIERGPIQRQTLGPQIGELVELAIAQPFSDHGRAHVLVVQQQLQAFPVAFDLAAEGDCGIDATGQETIQRIAQRIDRIDQHAQALAHFIAAKLQGVCDIGQAQIVARGAARVQMRAQALGLLTQLRFGARRQRHDQATVLAQHGRLGARDGPHVLDQHDVRVRTAETERADRGAATYARGRLPGLQRVVDVERAVFQANVFVVLRVVDGRRQLPFAQGQHQLDDASGAGGGEAVADIALDRTQRAEAGLRRERCERGLQAGHFDRVAKPGAGAVRFDQLDAGRVDVETAVHRLQQTHLRVFVRCGDAVGLAVLVDAPAFDHRLDAVAVAFGIGQALEQ